MARKKVGASSARNPSVSPLRLSLFFSALLLGGVALSYHLKDHPRRSAWSLSGENAHDHFGEKVFNAGDTNDDGFSDVAVFASGFNDNAGRIYVYPGSKRGPSRSPSFVASGESKHDQYGHSFGGVGDVNGDGFGDFIVAAQDFNAPGRPDAGKAYLYLGSPKGLAALPFWTRVGSQARELFGDCSGRAGDVNGDGLQDVLVGAYGHDGMRGRAYLFFGSKGKGLETDPAWVGSGEASGDWFGYSVASAGDVNGDGLPDAVIGAKMAGKGSLGRVGKVYVYHGTGKGLSAKPSWVGVGEGSYDLFGWRALSAGDVNGDGFGDLLVAAYGHDCVQGTDCGKVYLYYGSPSGLSTRPAWVQTGEMGGAMLGHSIGSGDFDGDGFSDVLLGAPGVRPSGKVYLYRGGPQGLSLVPDWTTLGEGGGFGSYVGNAGDVDGDGLMDFLVGAPSLDLGGEGSGKAYLFFGDKGARFGRLPR